MAFKLGRKAPDYRKPRLWAEDYYKVSELPSFKPSVDYASEVGNWPMYMNDTIGDCTIAGIGHMVGAWSRYAGGTEVVLTDDIIEAAYEVVGGYVPGNESTDNGCQMSDVLAYAQQYGIGGHKVTAFAQIKEVTELTLNQALQVFGSVYLGINCPQSAEDQFGKGPWTYVKGSPIIGGHCITLQKFQQNARGDYTIITWGAEQAMTLEFARTYIEEAWVALSPDWLTSNGNTITGLDVAALTADMSAL